jgi:hypothetical protein
VRTPDTLKRIRGLTWNLFSDLIGRVRIPVKDLMATPNKMIDRSDKLVGFEDATAMSGTLQ